MHGAVFEPSYRYRKEAYLPHGCVQAPRRFRERNRVAQQRYRSRQRERLQEKEIRLAELNQKLQALTTEKVL